MKGYKVKERGRKKIFFFGKFRSIRVPRCENNFISSKVFKVKMKGYIRYKSGDAKNFFLLTNLDLSRGPKWKKIFMNIWIYVQSKGEIDV